MRAFATMVITVAAVVVHARSGATQPALGPPASITLVVDQGTNFALDQDHAQYTPGSRVHLQAIVKDAAGNTIPYPEQAGCTPQFAVDDNVSADGQLGGAPIDQRRGLIVDQNGGPVSQIGGCTGPQCFVKFGPAQGVFHVEAHCKEAPQINSDTTGPNHMLNFE